MKIVPGAADDHRLVAHRRHVRAAGRARAHHDRDLRDALRRHARLVEEDPAEVVAVGEDLGLQRQERAAGVDEVEARQPVLLGDLLRAQVLLDREREVRAALDRRVVRDDHALAALDDADAGDDARARAPARRRAPTRRARSARGTPCRGRASRSIRSRASSLPRERCRSTARSPPPRATCAVRSRSSSTSASIRSRRRSNSSRCACDVSTAIGVSLPCRRRAPPSTPAAAPRARP